MTTTTATTSDTETTAEIVSRPAKRRIRRWMIAAAGIVLLLVVVLKWTTSSSSAAKHSRRVVAVAVVGREDLRETLTIAAEFRPYEQVSLHSKVAGFLQSISVDVGDHVKEGQVLAQLDVPELQRDLERDTAALHASEEQVKEAEATYNEAHLAAERLATVAKEHPKLVAQQDVDAAQAKDNSAAGAVGAAQQHVEEATAAINRTKTILSYASITAPFAGVITKRYVDPGALIQAGTSSAQVAPIVDIDEDTRLRLTFPVSESAVSHIEVGAPVHVSVSSLATEFDGKVARFSGKVDRATRTMETEVDVDNGDLRYKPGIYADATIVTQEHKGAIAVPIEALAVGQHPTVLVVKKDGSVEKREVKLGLQTPRRAEVLSGLQPGDQVIIGSRAGIQAGQKVKVKVAETPAASE